MDISTESTAIGFGNVAGTISKATDVNDGRMRMYDNAYPKTTDIPGQKAIASKRRENATAPESGTPEDRYVLLGLEREAIEKARDMDEAAEQQDKRDLALATMELLDVLRQLWQLRHIHSDEWGMVLNFLQISLAGEVFEEFTLDRCRAVRSVIERNLSIAATQDDVDECVAALESVGLDPMKPMAGCRE